ncbi:hypothetical protein BP00DRAFT_446749 [Aspergillus indologenus CBS 114.80]|uniref:Uncharacterized protein n=1 Tax=Aspergillus indologenus CBS 114.80 TaxID=1450541 RepID=A0A2V5J8Q3_9EURO|nr:hypothetical protein BP00DRAFT_446749 [Aspergillus indologenus CBS 114.80]
MASNVLSIPDEILAWHMRLQHWFPKEEGYEISSVLSSDGLGAAFHSITVHLQIPEKDIDHKFLALVLGECGWDADHMDHDGTVLDDRINYHSDHMLATLPYGSPFACGVVWHNAITLLRYKPEKHKYARCTAHGQNILDVKYEAGTIDSWFHRLKKKWRPETIPKGRSGFDTSRLRSHSKSPPESMILSLYVEKEVDNS